MKFGSLFSGIGGLDLGLERAGFHCVWQCEADPFCRSVLAKHWPNVPCHLDVRALKGADLEPVDCIAGGFPCQDVSQAGRRAEGIDGARSGLWREFERLIREVGPRFVLVENVTGLAARGLDRVLGGLASLGFDAGWGVLSAADCGAPHLRRRIFVVAARRPVPHAFGDVLRELGQRERQQHTEPGSPVARDAGADLAHGDRGGCKGERWADGQSQLQPRHEPDRRHLSFWPPSPDDMLAWRAVPPEAQPAVCRMADGLPAGVVRDRRRRLKALGNAVVPAQAEAIGRRLMGVVR